MNFQAYQHANIDKRSKSISFLSTVEGLTTPKTNSMHSLAANFILFLLFVSIIKDSENSLKTSSPVLEFRPKPLEGDEIWLAPNSSRSRYYQSDLDELLKPYFRSDYYSKNFLPPPCVSEHNYGYLRKRPCIFLTLTKFPTGWLPRYYTENELPTNMPNYLKQYVRYDVELKKRQTLWVSCEGENPADIEYLGPISFYPMGFPVDRLVNTTAEGYLSPLVAVNFLRPSVGIVISVRCTVWAKNIPRNSITDLGSVHIDLMVE